jgi:hypothetical protein
VTHPKFPGDNVHASPAKKKHLDKNINVPAIANVVTMQSAKARLINRVVVLFFIILCPIRVEMKRVLPIVERITRPVENIDKNTTSNK